MLLTNERSLGIVRVSSASTARLSSSEGLSAQSSSFFMLIIPHITDLLLSMKANAGGVVARNQRAVMPSTSNLQEASEWSLGNHNDINRFHSRPSGLGYCKRVPGFSANAVN